DALADLERILRRIGAASGVARGNLPDQRLGTRISTRENEKFRDNIIPIGVTSMSAGSKTNPGGYAVDPQSLEQFETSDERPATIIAQIIAAKGYEPVWKDWDNSYN
ncbi:MAG: hypothetical protein E2604_07605, partial [Flavobacterium sp.]|nr:hypothetical protein [Flavobacterium sp.]